MRCIFCGEGIALLWWRDTIQTNHRPALRPALKGEDTLESLAVFRKFKIQLVPPGRGDVDPWSFALMDYPSPRFRPIRADFKAQDELAILLDVCDADQTGAARMVISLPVTQQV
jgi:hypothetical protein